MERKWIYSVGGWSAYLFAFTSILTSIIVFILLPLRLPFNNVIAGFTRIPWILLIIPIAIAFYQQSRFYAKLLSIIALVVGIVGILYSTVAIFSVSFGETDFNRDDVFFTAAIGFWFLVTNFLLLFNNFQSRGFSLLGIFIGLVVLTSLFLKDSLFIIIGIPILLGGFLYPAWAFWTGRELLKMS